MMAGFKLNLGQTDGFGVKGRENQRSGTMREAFLSDGRTVRCEVNPSNGLWYWVWQDGAVPGKLSGAYTSADAALLGLTQYLSAATYNTKVTEQKVEIPVLKTKNVKTEV
jgi:hypothetical protein